MPVAHPSPRSLRWLFWLLVANVLSTVLHYADNVLYFSEYPEPAWATPHLVDAFWFVMTPFAAVGYVLIRRGAVHWGSLALYGYAGMSLLALGHYLYAPFASIALRIHAFILLEAATAAGLIGYVVVLQARVSARMRGSMRAQG